MQPGPTSPDNPPSPAPAPPPPEPEVADPAPDADDAAVTAEHAAPAAADAEEEEEEKERRGTRGRKRRRRGGPGASSSSSSPAGPRGLVMVKRDLLARCMTCPLCRRLLRDATTISECLHTFCRKCIYQKFNDEEVECCPVCKIDLGCTPTEKLRDAKKMQIANRPLADLVIWLK